MSTNETDTVEFKKGLCCVKFAEVMIGLNMGMRVPVRTVLAALVAAEKAGLDQDTGFFVAVAVGHRIAEHDDKLEAALEFAKVTGMPDVPVQTHLATVDDVIKDCDINRELAASMMEGKSVLPDDIAPKIREMAKERNVPESFTDSQVIVSLHGMIAHDETLEEVVDFCTGDTEFAKAVRASRTN